VRESPSRRLGAAASREIGGRARGEVCTIEPRMWPWARWEIADRDQALDALAESVSHDADQDAGRETGLRIRRPPRSLTHSQALCREMRSGPLPARQRGRGLMSPAFKKRPDVEAQERLCPTRRGGPRWCAAGGRGQELAPCQEEIVRRMAWRSLPAVNCGRRRRPSRACTQAKRARRTPCVAARDRKGGGTRRLGSGHRPCAGLVGERRTPSRSSISRSGCEEVGEREGRKEPSGEGTAEDPGAGRGARGGPDYHQAAGCLREREISERGGSLSVRAEDSAHGRHATRSRSRVHLGHGRANVERGHAGARENG